MLGLWLVSDYCWISREKIFDCLYLGPLSSGPCKVVLGLGVWVSSGGVRCFDDLFFRTTCSGGPTDDRSCRRCFLCFFFVFLTTFSSRTSSRYASASLSCAPCTRCSPRYFVDFFFGFFWPSGVSFSSFSSSSSSGWVGSPCRVFPAFSPWFLGGWGVRFVFFALHFSILRLLGRSRLGQPGVRARKPPGPHRACTFARVP